MKELLLSNYSSLKSKIFLSFYFISIWGLILALVIENNLIFEKYFNFNNQLNNINNIFIQVLQIIIPFICLIIVIDHDQDFINNLTTFKSRTKVFLSKILLITILNFLHILIITFIYLLSMLVLDFYTNEIIYFFKELLSIMIDCLIISYLIIYLTKKDNKVISYLLLVIYLFLSIFSNSLIDINLFYLFPVNTTKYLKYNFMDLLIYQILYLILISLLSLIKYNKQDIN